MLVIRYDILLNGFKYKLLNKQLKSIICPDEIKNTRGNLYCVYVIIFINQYILELFNNDFITKHFKILYTSHYSNDIFHEDN